MVELKTAGTSNSPYYGLHVMDRIEAHYIYFVFLYYNVNLNLFYLGRKPAFDPEDY